MIDEACKAFSMVPHAGPQVVTHSPGLIAATMMAVSIRLLSDSILISSALCLHYMSGWVA